MSPTVMRGDRLPNGSWNTICMRARNGAQAALVEAADLASLEADAALAVLQAQHRKSHGGLPEPLSPTSPTVSPARTDKRHAIDRPHRADHPAQHAAADREMHAHIVAPP